MRRKLFTLFTAAVGIASIASMAKAATVNYWIVTTTDPTTTTAGSWAVYADVSTGDNDGLAYYDLDVIATGGALVTGSASIGISNKAPKVTDNGDGSGNNLQYKDGAGGQMGFNSSFNNNGAVAAGSRTAIIGGQTTIYIGNDDPTNDMGIFVGVGQENGSASPQNGSQGPIDGSGIPVQGAPVNPWTYVNTTLYPGNPAMFQQTERGTLIEQGTYTDVGGAGGTLSVQADPGGPSEVLGTGEVIPAGGASFGSQTNYPAGSNRLWGYDPYQLGDTPIAISNGSTINVGVPEPASIGLLVLGMGMIGGGRKLRRKA